MLSILPGDSENGGGSDDAWEFVDEKNLHERSQHQEVHVQTWGIPWSPEQLVCQAVKAGHPMLLQACLPCLLKELVQEYDSTSTLARVQHRISRVKHWTARAKQLEEDDQNLVRSMRPRSLTMTIDELLHGTAAKERERERERERAAVTLARWCW